jgi:integrative and conjugative element protein (TIGR02256 family)
MTDLPDLQQRILRAAESGNYVELRRLQSLFRRTAVVASADRAGAMPVRLIETKAPTPARKRPSWLLDETTAPTAPRRVRIELRAKAEPRCEVVLERGARRAIGDELFLARAALRDERETGGQLLGVVSGDVVRIVVATGPGLGGVRLRHAVALDEREAAHAERELEEVFERAEVRHVGSWHSHPGRDRLSEPSQEDMVGALKQLANLNARGRDLPFVVTLIVTEDAGGEYWHPERNSHAWVVRHEYGRPVCEPASIRPPVKE